MCGGGKTRLTLNLIYVSIFRLRKWDPSRDVLVFIFFRSGPQARRKDFDDAVTRLRALGAHVFDKEMLPQRPYESTFYFAFDYQKLYLWNLPYKQVMYIDADTVLVKSPAEGFDRCRPFQLCAVSSYQSPGELHMPLAEAGPGSYFSNGIFVTKPSLPDALMLFRQW